MGPGHSQEVRAWLGSQGLVVLAWGCPDFRELCESSLCLSWPGHFSKAQEVTRGRSWSPLWPDVSEVSGGFEGCGAPSPPLLTTFTPSPSLSIPGADTMSETSSISMEATTDSRDTSVATSILLPFPASRGREEADNRSEHSYSESGASGSSFEELDLEVTGDGEGAPSLLPDVGYVGNQEVTDKWTKEPIAAERGEE